MICTVCDEDVVKAKVEVDAGKVRVLEAIEVLCEKRVSCDRTIASEKETGRELTEDVSW